VAQAPADKGCAFAVRCPLAHARCVSERPLLRASAGGHAAACHLAEAVAATPAGGELSALAQNV
jgi:ABC-type antimicrobial peptide transport system ATPase subunit